MEWKDITFKGLDLIKHILKNRFQTGDLSIGNIFLWKEAKKLQYKLDLDTLIIRGLEGSTPFIYPPLTDNSEKLNLIVHKFKKKCYHIKRIPEGLVDVLDSSLTLHIEEGHSDYIYEINDLINLSGKRYHKKKNHLNKFLKSYDYTYESIGEDNIKDVVTFQKNWCLDNNCSLKKGLDDEDKGIFSVLDNFEKLNLKGGVIRIQGKIIAYSFGEVITKDTALIHVEKADTNYDGSYQAINQLVLSNEFFNLKYVNREEDLGIDSLKKAKESYHPCYLIKKYKIKP